MKWENKIVFTSHEKLQIEQKLQYIDFISRQNFSLHDNDANILVMPGRFISQEEATRVVEAFLNTPFDGGRHQRRIDKIPL